MCQKCSPIFILNFPSRSELLFELFPFHLVFGHSMEIRGVGSAMAAVLPDIVGARLNDVFYLFRPIAKLEWHVVSLKINSYS